MKLNNDDFDKEMLFKIKKRFCFQYLEDVFPIELYYEVADAKITHLVRQRITVKVNGELYSTYVLDDDLDLFFNLLRLFKNYEYYVDGDEQSVSPIRLAQALKTYQT